MSQAIPATLKSLREAGEQLAAAALSAGLPGTVTVTDAQATTDAPASDTSASSLRERLDNDETVRRVLTIFGGRLDTIEETR